MNLPAWTILALIVGLAVFTLGFGAGRAHEERKHRRPRFAGYPFPPPPDVTGDAAARLAVEGDDIDPDVPARWPFAPPFGG